MAKSDQPAPQTTVPPLPAPRDRRADEPAPHGVVVEGMINPGPKQFDPANPAGAPRIEAVHGTDAQAKAHAELTGLLRKDTARMTPDERRAHDKRIHELHYEANGQGVPAR